MANRDIDGVDLIMRGGMVFAAVILATAYFANWRDEGGTYLFVFSLIVLLAGALRS